MCVNICRRYTCAQKAHKLAIAKRLIIRSLTYVYCATLGQLLSFGQLPRGSMNWEESTLILRAFFQNGVFMPPGYTATTFTFVALASRRRDSVYPRAPHFALQYTDSFARPPWAAVDMTFTIVPPVSFIVRKEASEKRIVPIRLPLRVSVTSSSE